MKWWIPVSAAFAAITLLASATAQEAAPDPNSPVESGETVTATATADNPQQDRSPTDYKSSEEISEDLSVSFPVDI